MGKKKKTQNLFWHERVALVCEQQEIAHELVGINNIHLAVSVECLMALAQYQDVQELQAEANIHDYAKDHHYNIGWDHPNPSYKQL